MLRITLQIGIEATMPLDCDNRGEIEFTCIQLTISTTMRTMR